MSFELQNNFQQPAATTPQAEVDNHEEYIPPALDELRIADCGLRIEDAASAGPTGCSNSAPVIPQSVSPHPSPLPLGEGVDSESRHASIVNSEVEVSPLKSPQSSSRLNPGRATPSLPSSKRSSISRAPDFSSAEFPEGTTAGEIEEANARALVCAEFVRLTGGEKRQRTGAVQDAGASYAAEQDGYVSGNVAAGMLGKAASWFSVMVPRYLREGVAGLLPRRRECGARPSAEAALLSEEDVKRIRFILLKSNRGRNAGSREFAVRKYAAWPECPEELRQVIAARYQAGKAVLPPSALNRIQVSRAQFGQFRNPSSAALDFFQSPGSAMWLTDEKTGQRQFIRSGQVVEGDDATINFVAVVPWEMGGCPCSEKFGVKAARFQLLLGIDVGSRKILGYTYVARPKSSYRGEDVVTLQNGISRVHGEPDFWRFERNVWESNAVQRRVKFAGSRLWTVYSPHAKPFVEGVFHKLWTILSLEKGQVGRFRGEMEKESLLLVACQQGQKDPRTVFCTLKEILEALDAAIKWHNESIIRSAHYGEWVPNERWELHQARVPNRRLESSLEWLAAPVVRDWTVRGNVAGGQVRLFDGYSAPFHFAADWLPNFDGVKVRAHFDPMLPRCSAMLTLAQPFAGRAAGEVLGTALLVDECASYARLVLEWGDDPRTTGRRASARAQSAMRREVRVIGKEGKSTEIRDGLGRAVKVEQGSMFKVPAVAEAMAGRQGPVPPAVAEPMAGRPALSRGERESEAASREVEARRFETENAMDFV